uniref:Uncharacterized protein n=1 Tax=candidate division CPR3 bacterium TaxID=2268181 RepID=A0A7V3N491_UNCC3
MSPLLRLLSFACSTPVPSFRQLPKRWDRGKATRKATKTKKNKEDRRNKKNNKNKKKKKNRKRKTGRKRVGLPTGYRRV